MAGVEAHRHVYWAIYCTADAGLDYCGACGQFTAGSFCPVMGNDPDRSRLWLGYFGDTVVVQKNQSSHWGSDMSHVVNMYRGWLFVKRGLLTMLSYRTALLLGLFSGLLGIVQFGLMAQFVSSGNNFPLIEQYGGDLLAYLIIGSVFTSFVGVALNSFQGAIRAEQQMGTLEHLLLADLSLTSILFYAALWNFLETLLNTAIIFAIAMLLFKVSISINLLVTSFILVLTVLSLSGIGMISAGIILVTKQGDPVGWIFTTLTGLLSGVMFPVEILPNWIKPLSMLLPTTHALKALRMTLTINAGILSVQNEILFLIGTMLLTFPLGLLVFQAGLRKAKREGSLSEY